MTQTYQSVAGEAAATAITVYTCPASTSAILFGGSFANKDGVSEVVVSLQINKGSGDFLILDKLPIGINDSYFLPDGFKIVLEANDVLKIHAGATGDVDYVLSLLEIS